jgi:hypothetical protein
MHQLIAYTVLKSKEISQDQKQKGVIADEKIIAVAVSVKTRCWQDELLTMIL